MGPTSVAFPRSILGPVLAVLLGPLASAGQPAPEGAIPPEVQSVLDKVRDHQPLTPEEQRILQLWTFRKSNGTQEHPQGKPAEDENAFMPSDVQQILARAQAGQLPSDAEKARLKAWAEQTRGRKDALLKDAATSGRLLTQAFHGGAPGAGPHPAGPGQGGTLSLDIHQTVRGQGGQMAYTATVQIPILFRLKDARDTKVPALHFQWWMDTRKAGSLDYSASGTARHDNPPGDCQSHVDHITAGVKVSANALTGRLFSQGQIVAPLGRRSFVDTTLTSLAQGPLTVACACGGGTHPAPPVLLPLTYDGVRGDVPFDFGVGDLPPVARPWKDRMPPEFRAMLDGATFPFDAEGLRRALAKGGPFTTSATYHWHLRTPEAESDSRTTFRFDLQLAPPEPGGIVVNPDPPQRGDTVSIQARVPGATRFHWTVTPRAAGDETPPAAFESDEDRLSFVALADFTVSVQPSDDSGPLDPPPPREVAVRPRAWTTARMKASEKTFVHPLMQAAQNTNEDELQPDGDLHLGESACAVDEGEGLVEGRHWIHHPHGTQDFHFPVKQGGFEDAQVPSGPWAHWFYVKDQGLKVQRVRLINADLMPGSALWKANVAAAAAVATRKPDIQALLDELRDHEQAHDDLAFEALDKVDPAPQIEPFIGRDEQALLDRVNRTCANADALLVDASSHAHVKARLLPTWGHSGYVLLPEPGGYRTFIIGNYAELGATPP